MNKYQVSSIRYNDFKRKLFSFVLLLATSYSILFFSGCEKDITVELPAPKDYIVVEGQIETGRFPFVILTKNSPYYETFHTSDLGNYFVHGATTIVKEYEGVTFLNADTLKEFILDTLGVKVSVYASFNIKGVEGRTYKLSVDADGKHLSSVTTIPTSYPLDSVWIKTDVDQYDPEHVRVYCRYTDPPSLGQYVRYFTKRNDEPFFPGLNSVFEDAVVNGTTFDFSLDRGVNRSDTANFDDYGYFFKGDTITVKWCNIDRANFDFWRTLEFELGNQGNPFASPTEVQTNITGGLGIWGGYSTYSKTLIAPK